MAFDMDYPAGGDIRLFIGCCCRVAGDADKRKGVRNIMKVNDTRDLFRALGAVDEDHFAIVENECVGVYSKEDFLPTPMPAGSCVLDIPDDKVVSGLPEEDRTDGNI